MRRVVLVFVSALLVAGVAGAQEYPNLRILDPVDGSPVSPDSLWMVEINLDPDISNIDVDEDCWFHFSITGEGISEYCFFFVGRKDSESPAPSFYSGFFGCGEELVMDIMSPRGDGGSSRHWKPTVTFVGNLRLPPEGQYFLTVDGMYGFCDPPADPFDHVSFYTTP